MKPYKVPTDREHDASIVRTKKRLDKLEKIIQEAGSK